MKTSTLLKRYIRLVVEGNEGRYLATTPEEIVQAFQDPKQTMNFDWMSASYLLKYAQRLASVGVSFLRDRDLFIGAGAYGTVLECIWGGSRRCAIKIITNSANFKDEVRSYQMAVKIAEQSGDAGQIFPRVFHTDEEFGFIVMEMLAPVHKGTLANFAGENQSDLLQVLRPGPGLKSSQEWSAGHLDKVEELLNTAWEEIEDGLVPGDVKEQFIAAVLKDMEQRLDIEFRLLQRPTSTHDSRGLTISRIIKLFDDAIERGYQKMLIPYPQRRVIDAAIEQVSTNFISRWRRSGMTQFPVDFGTNTFRNTPSEPLNPHLDHKKRESDLAVQQFLQRVQSLIKDKFIKALPDVHSGNVLMRPSTGELVVADVGLLSADN